MCLSVRNSASEYGLSLHTCGRLNDGTMPSHCKVAIIVLPRIGFPLSACSTSPVRIDAAFRTDPLHERGRSLGALVLVDVPAHDPPAPHVDDQIQTKKPPADHRRKVGNIPAPDLVRPHRPVDGRGPRHRRAKQRATARALIRRDVVSGTSSIPTRGTALRPPAGAPAVWASNGRTSALVMRASTWVSSRALRALPGRCRGPHRRSSTSGWRVQRWIVRGDTPIT